jgi:mediator of RNA polymerase II transcription subunit 12
MTEMPLNGLSVHVQNLRRTLLRGTVYSVDAEEHAIAATQDAIRQQLPGLFNTDMSSHGRTAVNVALLSSTVRLEVGVWLREQVVASTELADWYESYMLSLTFLTTNSIPTKDPAVVVRGTVCRITLQDFHVIRTYMEELDDLAIMADILGVVATSFDSSVLSAVADTLHHHYVAFRAIGAFEPLFERIAMRYAASRTVRFPERELLHSLIDLSKTARADPELMQLLSYDISRYDQKNSLAVCSPVSDNMMEGVAALDVEEEIERILSSGTSMDQQMMSRVFGKIAGHMEEQLCQGHQHVESFSTWLYRLRSFDESTFDMILSSWLRSLLLNHQLELLSAVLPPLVATGSLTLSQFLTTVRDCIRGRQASHPVDSLRIAHDGLERILPCRKFSGTCYQQDQYRYRLEQHKYCRQPSGGLLALVRDVVELEFSAAEHEHEMRLSSIISDSRLLDVLRYLAVHENQTLSILTNVGTQGAAPKKHARIKSVLDRLLDPGNLLGQYSLLYTATLTPFLLCIGLSSIGVEQQIATVVHSVDPLSLPFCQLLLQQIFSASTPQAEDEADRVSTALVAAIKTAIDEDQPCWPSLISGLEPSLTNKVSLRLCTYQQ